MFGKKNPRQLVAQELKALYPRLWRYCRAVTGNQTFADDLAQMTCTRALERADPFQAGTHFDRWAFRIAQNNWINELRAARVRQGGGLVPSEEIDIPDTKVNIETNILARQVLEEVGRLPEAQRSAVVLAYVEGYRYKEVAEILDIPIGTVMSRLSAARATLNRRLEERRNAG